MFKSYQPCFFSFSLWVRWGRHSSMYMVCFITIPTLFYKFFQHTYFYFLLNQYIHVFMLQIKHESIVRNLHCASAVMRYIKNFNRLVQSMLKLWQNLGHNMLLHYTKDCEWVKSWKSVFCHALGIWEQIFCAAKMPDEYFTGLLTHSRFPNTKTQRDSIRAQHRCASLEKTKRKQPAQRELSWARCHELWGLVIICKWVNTVNSSLCGLIAVHYLS